MISNKNGNKYTKKLLKWNHLALNGGSTKGISQVGALCYLDDNNLLDIKEYAGTSVGSVIATFHCAGFSGYDVWSFLQEIDIQKLFKPDMLSLIGKYGMDNGLSMELVIDNALEIKYGKKNMKFIELFNITNKLLIITATNLTQKKLEIYSVNTTPNMIISKAVRRSCGIPIMFEPIIDEKGNTIIDGGFMNNFPVDLLPKNNTLGIKIEPVLTTKYQNPEEYFFALLNLCQHCVMLRETGNDIDVLNISFQEIVNSFDFSLNSETKQKMFDLGYKRAKSYHMSILETFND